MFHVERSCWVSTSPLPPARCPALLQLRLARRVAAVGDRRAAIRQGVRVDQQLMAWGLGVWVEQRLPDVNPVQWLVPHQTALGQTDQGWEPIAAV